MPGSKRSSVLVAALVAALLLARPAQGSSILPGNSVTPVSFAGGCSCPIGDFAAFLGPVPWSISPFLHGGYVAGVFDRDPGAGVALEFLYQVHVDGQTAAVDEFGEAIALPDVYRMIMENFGGWATDVRYYDAGDEGGPYIAPSSADRSAGAGSIIGFSFWNPTIVGGTTSQIMAIQTNASAFTAGSLTIIAGTTVGDRVTVAAFQPSGTPPPPSVPEPASLLLLGTGVVAFRRRFTRR